MNGSIIVMVERVDEHKCVLQVEEWRKDADGWKNRLANPTQEK